MKLNHRIVILSALLITCLITGCGGGGGHSTPTTGSVSGTVYFDSLPTSSAIVPLNLGRKHSFAVLPFRRTSSFQPKTVPNEKVIKFKANLSLSAIEQIIHSLGGKIKRKVYGSDNIYAITINTTNLSPAAIKAHPGIEYIEDNQVFRALAEPNDPYYATDQVWNYTMLRLPQAWEIETGNSNIIVAVIDTGVALSHPDLADNLVAGYDFVDDDNTPSDSTYYNELNRYSHGTHVAGTISAVTNNSTGGAGVGWNVKIMPIRVLGINGYGTATDVAAGINWAAAHGAHIINLSLGLESSAAAAPQSMKDAIDAAVARGITIVAAAGNESHYVDFPANYSPVIAVSALGPDNTLTSYSNYGPEISVCAPGGVDSTPYSSNWILSTCYDKSNGTNIYAYSIGTSMACPHISGLVALLYGRGIASPEAVRDRLQTHATDLGTTGLDDYYGYGIPRADEVLSGSLPDIRSIKVFVGDTGGNILGTPRNPNSAGFYTIRNIAPGPHYICAFLDRNMDGIVNSGDKFAYINVNIKANTTITNRDIILLEQVSLDTPIPLAEYFKNLVTKQEAGF